MRAAPGKLVLATDLDGTMAQGEARVRERLLALLGERPGARLVYVTGRSVEAARELAGRERLPEPEVLIADVGTSVVHGMGPDSVAPIEEALDRAWPGGGPVRERLAALGDELESQDVRAPRRVSYWVEPVRRMHERPAGADAFAARRPDDPSLDGEAAALARGVAARAAEALDGLSVDVLLSANVFLDVLPRGVNKGSTLRRVLAWLGAAEDDCVVAGDSLNDLGLFETGMRGIAVGNAEPDLLRRVEGMERVYRAEAEGVAGVLEGLRHHLRRGTEGGEDRGE